MAGSEGISKDQWPVQNSLVFYSKISGQPLKWKSRMTIFCFQFIVLEEGRRDEEQIRKMKSG